MGKPRRTTHKAKRNGAKRSGASHDSAQAPSRADRNGAVRKALPGTVVIRPGAKPGRRGQEAVDTLSAGVQDALKRLASRRIPAVVRENDQLIVAIPRKVGGRYVVRPTKKGERRRDKPRHGGHRNSRP